MKLYLVFNAGLKHHGFQWFGRFDWLCIIVRFRCRSLSHGCCCRVAVLWQTSASVASKNTERHTASRKQSWYWLCDTPAHQARWTSIDDIPFTMWRLPLWSCTKLITRVFAKPWYCYSLDRRIVEEIHIDHIPLLVICNDVFGDTSNIHVELRTWVSECQVSASLPPWKDDWWSFRRTRWTWPFLSSLPPKTIYCVPRLQTLQIKTSAFSVVPVRKRSESYVLLATIASV